MIGWIIVIIAVVVGVVSHLAGMNKNQPQQPGGRAGGNAMPRGRPTSSEIDRFLEEVNRRKQQQQERRVPPPPVQREPQKQRQVLIEQHQPKQVVAKPVKVQQRQVIVAEPVSPTEIIIAQPVEPVVPLQAMTLTQLASINVPPTLTQRVDHPVVKQAKTMLKTQGGLRSVFVLNEILGQPRCRQPYKRRG
jgi:hypothetical protein